MNTETRRDWQVQAILPGNSYIDVDCNSGDKRHIKKSKCRCGQSILIERDWPTCRTDGKRIFYPDEPDTGLCVFRCKGCGDVIGDTAPGAEHGPHKTPNARHNRNE